MKLPRKHLPLPPGQEEWLRALNALLWEKMEELPHARPDPSHP